MRWAPLVAIGAAAFAIAGLLVLLSRVNLTAVKQPGRTEEYLRSKLTRPVIRRRAAHEEIPPAPAHRETSMSLAAGKNVYDIDCASCHGADGHMPTPAGRGMLPAAVALDSASAQSYSDRELFSIVRDGIRFTGMPGFAGTETSDQIWDVVDYLRSLR